MSWSPGVTPDDVEAFERCMRGHGVALFPADTVYGLACDPDASETVDRLYRLKGRRPDKPAAVMFFDREFALEALPELGERTRAALERVLPGGLTVLLPNPAARFPLACGSDPGTLGLRVPSLVGALAPLASMRRPVLQSSANRAGGPDARRIEEVPDDIRRGVDLVLEAGELPGTPSTVVDLRSYDARGEWSVVREGAVAATALAGGLDY